MANDIIAKGIAQSAIRVKTKHNFDTASNRDAYFISNPNELSEKTYCIANNILYQYKSNSWINITPIWKGSKGDQGNPCTVSIGTVISGDTASVTNSGTSVNSILNFILPKGDKGDTGKTGMTGASGIVWREEYDANANYIKNDAVYSNGATYYCHTPIIGVDPVDDITETYFHPLALMGASGQDGKDGNNATITVGVVNTLEPNESATVVNSGTASTAILDFGIPQGEKGDTGEQGLHWKGTYSPDAIYLINDAVYYGLKSFICVSDGTTGITPIETATEWDLLVNNSGAYLPHPKTAIPYWGIISELERGWQICDGTNNTPDLRSQFIRGASTDGDVGTTKASSTAQPKSGNFKVPEYKHSHTLSNNTTGDNYIDTVTNITGRQGLHSHDATTMDATAMRGYAWNAPMTPYPIKTDNGSNVEGSGGSYPKTDTEYNWAGHNLIHNHGVQVTNTNSNHQHRISLASAKANEVTRSEHYTTGGDTETAPQHILMYWITYVGSLAPNW